MLFFKIYPKNLHQAGNFQHPNNANSLKTVVLSTNSLTPGSSVLEKKLGKLVIKLQELFVRFKGSPYLIEARMEVLRPRVFQRKLFD